MNIYSKQQYMRQQFNNAKEVKFMLHAKTFRACAISLDFFGKHMKGNHSSLVRCNWKAVCRPTIWLKFFALSNMKLMNVLIMRYSGCERLCTRENCVVIDELILVTRIDMVIYLKCKSDVNLCSSLLKTL